MSTPLKPGFIALHGNRSEDLAQAVIAWLAQNPLAPLEPLELRERQVWAPRPVRREQ
jgi:hypothetical protein